MPSTRQIVYGFIKHGDISPENTEQALSETKISPNFIAWTTFFDRLLLTLGLLSLGFATLFFIAYNWNELGRFSKFLLLEALIISTIFLYIRSPQNSLKAQLSLLLSCFGVGILMAFFGQTYQTGADPWTLFFYWALLITPWVIIARLAALWLSWLILLNTSLALYIESFGSPLPLLLIAADELHLMLFIFNAISLLLLEVNINRFSYLSPRWLPRSIASFSGFMITIALIDSIFSGTAHSQLPFLLWLGFIISLYIGYRHLRLDLFMLAGGCLSVTTIVTTFSVKAISDTLDEGFLLFISFIIITLTTISAYWLKRVHKEIL